MTFLEALPGGAQRPWSSHASVRVEAPGKVNLFLSAAAPTPDGYHPLTTVFQAVRLIETVTARCQSAQAAGQITLRLEDHDAAPAPGTSPHPGSAQGAAPAVPLDERNLAYKAAALLASHTGVEQGVDLTLRKRVPVAGGMAGGSADAAATLVACNTLWGTGLSMAELSALAAQLGADVPFPLAGYTALGTSRGDQLSPLMTRGTYHWVFALAPVGLSTPEVFAQLDRRVLPVEPAQVPQGLTAALRAGDPHELARHMHNDLQEPALELRPELRDVIECAQEAGALRAMISGSGPTVAALVPDATTGARVARALDASGLCAGTVRTDAPVAGARVMG